MREHAKKKAIQKGEPDTTLPSSNERAEHSKKRCPWRELIMRWEPVLFASLAVIQYVHTLRVHTLGEMDPRLGCLCFNTTSNKEA